VSDRARWIIMSTAASLSTLVGASEPGRNGGIHMAFAPPSFSPPLARVAALGACKLPAAGPASRGARPLFPPGTGVPRRALFSVARAAAEAGAQASAAPPEEEEVDPGVVAGTDLRVLKYPHPSLRAPDGEVTEFDDALKKIVREMFLVMYAAKGVGLAAPQVGINQRIMVYNPEGDRKKWLQEVALVNPKIVETSEGKDVEEEACLSFPGLSGEVQRFKWIKVEAQDIRGKAIKKKFLGWEARVFQHEYDHLDGTCYIDLLDEETRARVQPVLDSLIETYKGENAGDAGAL